MPSYSYIPGIHQMNGHYMDWTTYLRDNPMTTYRGMVPNGPVNKFYEVPAVEFTLGKKVSFSLFIHVKFKFR